MFFSSKLLDSTNSSLVIKTRLFHLRYNLFSIDNSHQVMDHSATQTIQLALSTQSTCSSLSSWQDKGTLHGNLHKIRSNACSNIASENKLQSQCILPTAIPIILLSQTQNPWIYSPRKECTLQLVVSDNQC